MKRIIGMAIIIVVLFMLLRSINASGAAEEPYFWCQQTGPGEVTVSFDPAGRPFDSAQVYIAGKNVMLTEVVPDPDLRLVLQNDVENSYLARYAAGLYWGLPSRTEPTTLFKLRYKSNGRGLLLFQYSPTIHETMAANRGRKLPIYKTWGCMVFR